MADFTPVDTFTSPVPALSDGQPANAAVLNAPHQALVNRTHWLKATIDSAGITRDGATRIREVADEAALKALTGMADGDLAITQDKALLFRYSASAADTELARWVVAPASGVGRWLNTAYKLVGGANGIVKTDANERIPAAMPKNGVVALASGIFGWGQSVSSSSLVELAGHEVTVADVEAGDVVEVHACVNYTMTSDGAWQWYTMRAVDGDSTLVDVSWWGKSPGGGWGRASALGRFVATKAGAHRIYTEARIESGTGPVVIESGTMFLVTVYRP